MVKIKRSGITLTEGPILKNMILYAIPIILTGLLQVLYNTVDMVVVGQWAPNGELASGAVGSCSSLINLIVQLFMGLAVGAGVSVAHDIGAQREDDVRRMIHTAVPVAAISGIAVGVFGFIASKYLLELTGVVEPLLSEAVPYMQAYMVGIPASLVYNYCAAMLRSSGDTTRPMVFLAISGLVNVVANLVAVIGFGMGAVGVGIGTAISNWCAMIFILVYMIREKGIMHLDFRKLRIYRDRLWKIISIGIPSGIQGCVFAVSNVIIQSSINSFKSSAVIAGNTAAGNLEGFVYNVMHAFYDTTLTFAGQNMGAKKLERVKKSYINGMLGGCGSSIIVCVILLLLAHPLLSMYGIETEEAFSSGIVRMNIIFTFYWMLAAHEVQCGFMRGLGHSMVSMLCSVLGICGIRIIWIYTVFPIWHTLEGLLVIYPVSWGITVVVEAFCCIFIYKHKKALMSRGEMLPPVSQK